MASWCLRMDWGSLVCPEGSRGSALAQKGPSQALCTYPRSRAWIWGSVTLCWIHGTPGLCPYCTLCPSAFLAQGLRLRTNQLTCLGFGRGSPLPSSDGGYIFQGAGSGDLAIHSGQPLEEHEPEPETQAGGSWILSPSAPGRVVKPHQPSIPTLGVWDPAPQMIATLPAQTPV